MPSDPVRARNASAYVLTVGDVQEDVSKAQVWFDKPQTDNSIVIYGVKRLNLHELTYNRKEHYPELIVKLYSGENVAHQVGVHLTEKWGIVHFT